MAPTSTDPRDVLGLPQSFTDEQLRRAWLAAAERHHPDRGGDREKFEQARAAFECLRDPERRRQVEDGHFDFEAFVEQISSRVVDSIPDLKEMREQARMARSGGDWFDRLGAGAKLVLTGINVRRRLRGD